jgi:hypothetical protein
MLALPRSKGIKKEGEDVGDKQELSASEEVVSHTRKR